MSTSSVGTVGLAVRLPGDVDVAKVRFRVSGGGLMAPFEGEIDARGGSEVSKFIGGAPAGRGYRLDLSATSRDQRSRCTGATNGVEIRGGGTTSVTVVLGCGSADAAGGAKVCPLITAAAASPLTAPTNGQVSLTASGSDFGGMAMLTFAWKATAGRLDPPGVANTTYHCPSVPGPQQLTVTVSDGDPACSNGTNVQVVCIGSGPGAPDAANAADAAIGAAPDAAAPALSDAAPVLPAADADAVKVDAGSPADASAINPVDARSGNEGGPPDARGSMPEASTVVDVCLMCESTNPDPDCAPRYKACASLAGVAAAGPAAGQPRSTLCLDLLTCVHATLCNGSALGDCFCGPGGDAAACRAMPRGPCRAAFYAAGESTDNAAILARLEDPGVALGVAGLLITRCEQQPSPRCGFACRR